MITRKEMLDLLHADVVPAVGCTEPVCVALAAADAAAAAAAAQNGAGGAGPSRPAAPVGSVRVAVSPNVYKNGMSVSIPGYPGVGLDAAAALGALLADPAPGLELLAGLTPEVSRQAGRLCAEGRVRVGIDAGERGVFVRAEVEAGGRVATTTIRGGHTDVVERTMDGEVTFRAEPGGDASSGGDVLARLRAMRVAEILDLVRQADEQDLEFLLDGVEMNEAAADFGASHDVGVGIARTMGEELGSPLLGDGLLARCMLRVASATEARLGGGMLPCMSSSGAGTKGLVVILPVSELAREVGASRARTAQALAFAHLLNRYVNLHIGKLAAVCTCVMASATAASAAMAWLLGASDVEVGYAIRNMAGTTTGMVCDGGKVGCALKVSTGCAAALNCAILAAHGVALPVSDGICAETPEQCIENMTRVGDPGMLRADEEILGIMLEKSRPEDAGAASVEEG